MRRAALVGICLLAVATAIGLSSNSSGPAGFRTQAEATNPWTHLRFNNDAATTRFVVVSDRTGGHREKVFSRAVEQINLIQPEFVLSVGDLIEGYSTNEATVARQWNEFESFTKRFEMPFFYVPGNHDLTNPFMVQVWNQRFGKTYYHFVYKDILFLLLNSEDPPGSNGFSPEQVKFVERVCAEVPNPRWTFVALHKPIWTGNAEANGWLAVEKILASRPYTVFAGHVHRYEKFTRNGRAYYQLATTGGSSQLRGVAAGEFDHVMQVTVRPQGPPVLANLLLDGILTESLRVPETVEPVGR